MAQQEIFFLNVNAQNYKLLPHIFHLHKYLKYDEYLPQILQLKSLETPAKSKHPPVYANMKSRNVNLLEFLVGGTCLPGFHHSLVFHHTCGILSGLKLNIAGEITSKD